MKLLIVEDERRVRDFLARGFGEEGFGVAECSHGHAALEMLAEDRFDLVLLDWMLPRIAGIDVLTLARARGDTTPIIILTARDAPAERLQALNSGADGYIVKPFSFEELLAWVRTVLRRAGRSNPNLSCGDLTLDPVKHVVRRAGVEIRLTAREFALLKKLLEHCGEPLSRTGIVEAVWERDLEKSSNVVDVYIRRLRTKIDKPFNRPLIHTLRGVGYVIQDRG